MQRSYFLSIDFLSKLWDSDSNNLNPNLIKLKTPVKKPKKKCYKAQSVEKVTVEQLLASLENQSFSLTNQPYTSLFDLYSKEFLNISLDKGLINNSHLTIAGDGTPIVTSARERNITFVTALKNVLQIVITNANSLSLTATWDRIRHATVFITDMIYICLSHLILKATFPYFQCFLLHQFMILMDFFIPFLSEKFSL